MVSSTLWQVNIVPGNQHFEQLNHRTKWATASKLYVELPEEQTSTHSSDQSLSRWLLVGGCSLLYFNDCKIRVCLKMGYIPQNTISKNHVPIGENCHFGYHPPFETSACLYLYSTIYTYIYIYIYIIYIYIYIIYTCYICDSLPWMINIHQDPSSPAGRSNHSRRGDQVNRDAGDFFLGKQFLPKVRGCHQLKIYS